jgi:hypothetical protein
MQIDPASVLTRAALAAQAPTVLAACYAECLRLAGNERERQYLEATLTRSQAKLAAVSFTDAPLGEVGRLVYQAYCASALRTNDLDAGEVWLWLFADNVVELLSSEIALLDDVDQN